ncbi:MAG TPA: hypothetical protein VHP63_05620, partial [candidate division Zixibacteria bacterium]|nr:hypothetical protein [candidate division Zixibacteria bacterium]
SQDSIRAISASGGQITAVTTIDRKNGELYHAWPQFLPDGEHFLYLANKDTTQSSDNFDVKVGSLNSKESKTLMTVNTLVRYSRQGYILFVREKILLAQRFDSDNLELVGEPVPITDKVRISGMARANFSLSDEGTLVLQNESSSQQTLLKWFDRSGRELGVVGEPAHYVDANLSPDETKIAFVMEDEKNRNYDIWIYDLNRNAASRLTFDPGDELFPRWSPDGNEVYYYIGALPRMHAYTKLANGSSDANKIAWPDSLQMFITDISSDGSRFCNSVIKSSQVDVQVFQLANDTPITSVTTSTFFEFGGQFSPDDQYVAFVGNESGKFEIYVKRSDGTGGKWQVSVNGGASHDWSADGKEMFYWALDNTLMAVSVNTKGGFQAGTPKKLFKQSSIQFEQPSQAWDVTKDGQRFLVVAPLETAQQPTFDVVLNWTAGLESK